MKQRQRDRVLQYMQRFGSITTAEAFFDLGVTRLSARIFELKKDGYKIKSEGLASTNRFGEHCTYARYMFVGEEQ